MTREEMLEKKKKLQEEMLAEINDNHLFESDGKTLDGRKNPKLKEIEDKYLPQID